MRKIRLSFLIELELCKEHNLELDRIQKARAE
jgi:hypothetical protein